MNVLDLFSGIGGFSLGLERAGMRTVAFCEIEPFCRQVLAKHWPEVPCYSDIRTLTADRLRADGVAAIDAICGGFPCQDISLAGTGAGIQGQRSGLWAEYARLIGELRPKFVFVENVAALLGRGLDVVLGQLSEIGYDAEWEFISGSSVGAPHNRERIWIIAYPYEIGRDRPGRYFESVDVLCDRRQWTAAPFNGWRDVEHWLKSDSANSIWAPTDRETCGMDDGILRGLDRPDIGALGNAVIPQIPEAIGRAVMKSALTSREGT